MSINQVFIYLQVLDLLTTLVGFRLGAEEASPFIRMLMHVSPAAGVAIAKILAVGLGGLCIYAGKQHLMRWMNYWYGGLVIWNLGIMLAVS